MKNLALNKLPLEKTIWNRVELSTNGDVSNYTGVDGFAWAVWPCDFTIDLESEFRINTIRFLLWDNLILSKGKPDDRKYKFSLSISNDGQNFITIFSNQNDKGGNGWFSFTFLNDTYARYIRLTGHHNTANGEFHLIEFEIYDEEPQKIPSSNFHHFNINSGLPGIGVVEQLIEKAISSKTDILQGIEAKIKLVNDNIEKSGTALNTIEIIKKSHDFLTEAISNQKRATGWLIASTIFFLVFLKLLYHFIFCDEHSKDIIRDAMKDEQLKYFTGVLLGAYYFTKAILMSTILFIMTWFLKNYRTEKHNYIINKHKAMSLTVAISVLTKEDFNKAERSKIFNQAMEIIFSHQSTGITKDEGAQPNIVNTILSKAVPSIDGK